MNYVEISDLLTKGFTPEQIVMLAGANPPAPQGEPSPEPKPDEKQDPAPEPEHSPEPKPDEKQDPAPEPEHSPEPSPEMKALRDEMKALKEAIQATNIMKEHFDNIPPSDSTESILAGIIRPPFENKKD